MVTVHINDGVTTRTWVTDQLTVISRPGGQPLAINTNQAYEQPLLPAPAPTYGSVQQAIGARECATLPSAVHYPVHRAVYHGPAHVQAYSPFNVEGSAGARYGAFNVVQPPVYSPVPAANHVARNGPVQAPIPVPIRSAGRATSIARQDVVYPQVRTEVAARVPTTAAPRSRDPQKAADQQGHGLIPSRLENAANASSGGRRNVVKPPPAKAAPNAEVKKRGIRWSAPLEAGKAALPKTHLSTTPHGIVRQPHRNLISNTPSFRLEFTFEGRPYGVPFVTRKAGKNLLRLFEESIIGAVDSGQKASIREGLKDGYKLEYGYWGKTLIRAIRGSTVEDPDASFHAFLNGVRNDAIVKIV